MNEEHGQADGAQFKGAKSEQEAAAAVRPAEPSAERGAGPAVVAAGGAAF